VIFKIDQPPGLAIQVVDLHVYNPNCPYSSSHCPLSICSCMVFSAPLRGFLECFHVSRVFVCLRVCECVSKLRECVSELLECASELSRDFYIYASASESFLVFSSGTECFREVPESSSALRYIEIFNMHFSRSTRVCHCYESRSSCTSAYCIIVLVCESSMSV
jgi:hypothetical protein